MECERHGFGFYKSGGKYRILGNHRIFSGKDNLSFPIGVLPSHKCIALRRRDNGQCSQRISSVDFPFLHHFLPVLEGCDIGCALPDCIDLYAVGVHILFCNGQTSHKVHHFPQCH